MAKQPLRPLSTINIMEEPPAPSVTEPERPQLPAVTPRVVEDEAAPPPEPRRQMNYRPTVSTAERLRLIGFRQRRPVQELIDEAVMLWLANQK